MDQCHLSYLSLLYSQPSFPHWTLHADLLFKLNLPYLSCVSASLTSSILDWFQWPWAWLGVTISGEQTQLASCSHTTKWDEVWCYNAKQLKSILALLLSSSYIVQGNNCCSTDCMKKCWLFHDMHSVIYELIWFKLGMMVDTTEVYILILVWVTLTSIRGHRDVRKFLHQ